MTCIYNFSSINTHVSSYATGAFSASMSVVVCDSAKKAESMLEQVAKTPSLKCIVMMEPVSAELTSHAKDAGVDLLSYKETMVGFLLLISASVGEDNLIFPHLKKTTCCLVFQGLKKHCVLTLKW